MPYTTHSDVMSTYRRRSIRRRIIVTLRDTAILFREFYGILLAFVIVVLLGAWSFTVLWNLSQDTEMRFIQAVYFILTMMIFEPTLDFPEQWFLDIYFFVMPVIGVGFVALGAADFVILLFNRRSRRDEWEETVASTFNNHVIVVGLGRVGLRVVRELVILGEEVVIVETKDKPGLFEEMHSYDIPIIKGDGRSEETLHKAGIDRASAVVICTNDDLMNLQIGSRVRDLNKDTRLVLRMFDDAFAGHMARSLNCQAIISASAMAAPAFAGAAVASEIMNTFKVENKALAMGRIEVKHHSRLDGATVKDVEAQMEVSIVLRQSEGQVNIPPRPEVTLYGGDVIVVIAPLNVVKQISSVWNR